MTLLKIPQGNQIQQFQQAPQIPTQPPAPVDLTGAHFDKSNISIFQS